MNTRQEIDSFMSQKSLAVAGMSRDPKAFSAYIAKELRAKGYTLYPVNPNAKEIDGQPCYATLAEIPVQVGGVLVLTSPKVTETVVREAAEAGIRRVWIQQGATSQAAQDVAVSRGMEIVSGECVMMFAEPVTSIHSFHRFVKKLFGGLPRAEKKAS